MANSAFLPFIFQIQFTDWILRNLRKIEGSFDDFQSKRNWIPKVENFFKLSDYKWIFLKWDWTIQIFLEIIKISQSTAYFIIFIWKYTV
jgi:hypothetical protein